MKLLILFLCFCVCCNSCQKTLGKYIYFDEKKILHIDSKCENITEVKNAKPLYPVELNKFYIDGDVSFMTCASCVRDKDFERLIKTGKENRYNKSYNYARKLFFLLVEETDEYFPQFKQFCYLLNDEEYRSKLYNILSDKCKLPDYSTFTNDSLAHIDIYSLTVWDN